MPAAIDWTPELEEALIEALAETNLYRLCNEDARFPSRWTVLRYMERNPEFATRCARADKLRGQKWATKIELAAEACDEETAQSAKVKISAYQWLASKEDAKYGEKMQHTGADGQGPAVFVLERIGKK